MGNKQEELEICVRL